jgi:hypothetical protein
MLFDMGKAALATDIDSAMEAALLWQALCINISEDKKGLMKVVLPNLLQQVLEKLQITH